MSRYTTDAFTSAAVPANGGHLDIERTLTGNNLDISKIKVVPSDGTNTNVLQIHKKAARAVADLLLTTKPFTGTLYVDPPDSGGAELNEASVCPYYDADEGLKLHLRIINNHSATKTYDVTIEYEVGQSSPSAVLGVPEGVNSVQATQPDTQPSTQTGTQGSSGVYAIATVNGLSIIFGVTGTKFMDTTIEAELRMAYFASGVYGTSVDMRTAAEGGSFVDNGTTQRIITGIAATNIGAQYKYTSAAQGRWFFAMRLKNSVGWSLWTDGNVTPSNVTQYTDTKDASTVDSGPPADWEVWLEPGPTPNTVIAHATRPRTNGTNLLYWLVQVKDADTGSWREVDANAGAAETHYDGSAVSHTISADGTTISKVAAGWGTAVEGDLVLWDRRGSNFGLAYCNWTWIVPGGIGANTLQCYGFMHPDSFTDVRIKIVKPPWAWVTEGYLGLEPNSGIWPGPGEGSGLGINFIYNDHVSQEFITTPIPIPATVTNPEVRVWFNSLYSFSDDGLRHSSGIVGSGGTFGPRLLKDFNNRGLWLPVIPDANFGTLIFNADGSVVSAVAGTSETAHAGAVGVRGRFKILGDDNFLVIVRAKWTNVIFPAGLNAGDRLALGVWFFQGMQMYGQMTGSMIEMKGSDSAHVNFGAAGVALKIYQGLIATYGADVFAAGYDFDSVQKGKPTDGATIEILAQWGDATFKKNFGLANEGYRSGGGGAYVYYTSTASGRVGHGYFRGMVPFVGWIGNCRLNGATATLTEFEITNGLGEII
jgi:hypothetical protein